MKEYRMSLPKLFEKLIQVFGSISAISGKKILVIRDLEVALMLSVRNAVVYITDDEECSEAFRKNTEVGMGNDDEVFFINNYTTELKEKIKDMHFDVAVQNPPYERNLHLKILAEVLTHADKVINISPVRWLQDPFAPYSTRSDYCKFEDSVSKKIETLDIVPAKHASEIFDAGFTMNLAIYVCSEHGGYNYHHDDPLTTKMVEKTIESNWKAFSWQDFYAGNIPVKNYKLNIAPIHSKDAKFPIMCQTYEKQIEVQPAKKRTDGNGGMGQNGGHFEFDSDVERRNFYDCYNHPFMIWWVKQWKEDVNVMGYKIPYFGDYTHPWDYADFFAWFNLTEEEQERVKQEIAEMQAE